MRRTHLLACAATVAASLGAVSVAQAKPDDVSSSKLESAVTVEGILKHQQALQTIANFNGGTRHTRTAGYTASAAYVKATLENAGYDARYEMFNMPEWEETAPPVLQQVTPTAKTYTPGTAADDGSPAVDFITFEHSPTASVSNVRVVPTNDVTACRNAPGASMWERWPAFAIGTKRAPEIAAAICFISAAGVT